MTESKEIANAFTDYYEPLFADKPVSDAAKELCLRKLRSGNRVLAPTAARCGSEITQETIEHTCTTAPCGGVVRPAPDKGAGTQDRRRLDKCARTSISAAWPRPRS